MFAQEVREGVGEGAMELLGIYSIIYIDTRNCATEIIYKHDDEARWHEDSVDYRLRRWGTKKR